MAKSNAVATAKTAKASEVFADYSKNPRGAGLLPSKVDPESFEILKRSLQNVGQITPITCVAVPERDGAKYRVVAGYRRFEAMNALGFETVHIMCLPDTALEYGVEGPEDGTQEMREFSSAAGELVLATVENTARQDVSTWDRAVIAARLRLEGASLPEIQELLAEGGHKVTLNQTSVYTRIGSLNVKLRNRLAKLKGAGYNIALEITGREFNLSKFPDVKWDTVKQTERADALIAAAANAKKDKGKEKTEKKTKWVLSASEVKGRLPEIQPLVSPDTFAILRFMLGEANRAELVDSTDEELATALTGEGPESPEDMPGKGEKLGEETDPHTPRVCGGCRV